jgi:antitoxin VapB
MKTARAVRDDSQQTVRLPVEFRIYGNEVGVHRIGRSLLLIPSDADRWRMLVDSLDRFTEDYIRERAQPAEQERDPLFP